jgi:hypothetical protein
MFFYFSILKTILSLIYIHTIMPFTPINELPKPAQFFLDELEKEEKKEILLNNYMKEILETHPVTNLKSILREMKQEVGSYSKMKKAELIERIMHLKKKGFPVPKVEKYVKPARKKVAKKTAPVQGPKNLVKGFGIKKPAPEAPAPNFILSKKELNDKVDKFISMDKKEYAKYLKGLPKKIPNEKDTKAVNEFLKAHEGLGFGWKFHKGKSANDDYFFRQNAEFYNGLSRNRKLKFLDLYINKTLPELKSTPGIYNLSGQDKPDIISIIMNRPTDAQLKEYIEESKELFTELDYRFRPKRPADAKYPPSKILKIGNEEGLKKVEELAKDLQINRNIIYRYTGKEVIEPYSLQYLFDGIKSDRTRYGAELYHAKKKKEPFTFTIDHSRKAN